MTIINELLAAGIALLALALWVAIARWRGARSQAAQLEARLRQLEDRPHSQPAWAGAEAISEAAYNALLLVDASRQTLHLNPAARRLFGVEAAAPGLSLMAVTRHHELDDLVRQALEIGDLLERQIDLQGRPYRARATVLPPAGVKPVMASLALEDVSELQRLGRARRDMVANISHELRTPITSIRLMVDTLMRGALADPQQRDSLLTNIAAETDALQQVAQELLDLSMIESGRLEMRLVGVTLRSISQRAIERLSEQISRKHQSVDDRIPAGLRALADPDQVERVLVNLLHNAIKFTPERGRITLDGKLDMEWVTLVVEDTGPGIPLAERERVFERFYRADRSRSGGGTGLGLAIAKHIVTAHGGRIWVESRPREQGARLCLTLPAQDDLSAGS